MKRQWLLAIGSGALLSGIALFAVTLAAVPTTTIFGSEVPMACANGSSQQACADATARLTVMKQIQPISWFITAVGAVLLVHTRPPKNDGTRPTIVPIPATWWPGKLALHPPRCGSLRSLIRSRSLASGTNRK